jgi:signal transduction histidine kinase
MKKQTSETENESMSQQLEAGFTLAGYLLEAHDEQAAITAAMRAGNDLLGAVGCTFIPFNEWEQSLPSLQQGDLDFSQNRDWQSRLSAPATRQACRVCQSRQAGGDCILLQEPADAEYVCCVALRCGGREIGIINFFFNEESQINASQHRFLAEMVRLTDLALVSLRTHSQEKEALRRENSCEISKEILISMDAENSGLLERLEYRAVLEERSRLAREIHDGLAQTLAFLKIEAARMQRYIANGEVRSIDNTLQACYQTLSEAYLDARQAIDNLRRVPDEALSDWLHTTANDFNTLTGVEVNVSSARLAYPFKPSIKAQVIRIVQEALTNIRKHAQACTVSISAIEREGEALIEIRDNGMGFSPEDIHTSQYGLRSMRERAESIGADFQVTSTPGTGTTVRLQIPIRDRVNP